MLTTDYELVFPQCGDVEGYYTTTPKGIVCNGELIASLGQDFYPIETNYSTALDDLNSYMRYVENQDDNTLSELKERSVAYREDLVNAIAETLVAIIAVARAHDVSDTDIQLGVDRYVGLAS